MTDEELNECSAQSCGVYIKIMCLMHKSEQYGKILLKQKDKQSIEQIENFALKLIKHTPYAFDIILASLSELINEGCLYIDGDALCQKRMIHDNLISIKRAEAGAVGGKTTQSAKAKHQANSQANSEYEYENAINIKFECFWDLYNKKKGDKAGCVKKWNKLSDQERQTIIDILPQWKMSTFTDPKYQPLPATFLNQKRWEDDISAPISEPQINRIPAIKPLDV